VDALRLSSSSSDVIKSHIIYIVFYAFPPQGLNVHVLALIENRTLAKIMHTHTHAHKMRAISLFVVFIFLFVLIFGVIIFQITEKSPYFISGIIPLATTDQTQ
jgi:hypothetical protein